MLRFYELNIADLRMLCARRNGCKDFCPRRSGLKIFSQYTAIDKMWIWPTIIHPRVYVLHGVLYWDDGCIYVSVGQGSCRDDTMQSPPYCQVGPQELSSYPIPSLSECEDLCDTFTECVAIVYDSSFGCRIHFYDYSDAQDAGNSLQLTGFGCIQGGATGDITQTNGSGSWECLVKGLQKNKTFVFFSFLNFAKE